MAGDDGIAARFDAHHVKCRRGRQISGFAVFGGAADGSRLATFVDAAGVGAGAVVAILGAFCGETVSSSVEKTVSMPPMRSTSTAATVAHAAPPAKAHQTARTRM